MEELRVTNLLGGALAAISGAVVASFLGVFGTLAGAGVMSIFMAVATAGYAHSLAATHRWIRRMLVRRVGDDAETDTPPAQPIRWQRVVLAAAVVFALAIGAVTTVEAVARRPLASLLGSQPAGASTSVGVVMGQSAARAPRAPNTSTTSPPASASTTVPAGVVTTTAPAGAVPSTTAPSTTAPLTPSTYAPTTQRR
jgi:hypothetical protein